VKKGSGVARELISVEDPRGRMGVLLDDVLKRCGAGRKLVLFQGDKRPKSYPEDKLTDLGLVNVIFSPGGKRRTMTLSLSGNGSGGEIRFDLKSYWYLAVSGEPLPPDNGRSIVFRP